MVFQYGDREINHLKRQDKLLGAAIESIGPIRRAVEPDLFSALIRHIVGQQISTKAADTVWRRMQEYFQEMTPEIIAAASKERIQAFGMTFKKAENIIKIAEKVKSKQLDLAALSDKNDEEVCRELMSLDGVGRWTAEMLMLFSMQRPNILSFDDLGIRRGMQRLYGFDKLTKKQFNQYKERFAPYGSVASLYLWALAGQG